MSDKETSLWENRLNSLNHLQKSLHYITIISVIMFTMLIPLKMLNII